MPTQNVRDHGSGSSLSRWSGDRVLEVRGGDRGAKGSRPAVYAAYGSCRTPGVAARLGKSIRTSQELADA
jgi:hypothetical protein